MNLTATFNNPMPELERSLADYVALSKRSVPEVVAQKGGQIILGNRGGKYGVAFPGLFEILRAEAPREGSITTDRLAALESAPRGAKRPVKVRHTARERAKAMLGSRPSGLIRFLPFGSSGRFRVNQVRFRKDKPSKAILSRSNRGGTIRRNTRAEGVPHGWKLLNLVALSIAVELSMRESGRGYTAFAFLPRSYSAFLRASSTVGRASSASLRGELAKPMPSVNLSGEHRNMGGDRLGDAQMSTQGDGAALRIRAYPPSLRTPALRERAYQVVRYVLADTRTYVHRKMAQENLQRTVRGVGARAPRGAS